MNYREAREYLEKINRSGNIVLGLESIYRLLNRLGNPQKDLKAVHIAGTNGKGSIMTFLQSILMEAGYNVGRYCSPAVFEYREIIRYNDKYIEEESLAEIISFIKEKCDEMEREGFAYPTPFEIETAMAFLYFKKKKCDIVLVECGLGGETDATNVFEKVLCSIIATISLDHMKFLGNTVEQITKVKTGIIKEGCPVVVTDQSEEVLDIIREVSKIKKAELVVTKKTDAAVVKNFRTILDYKATDGAVYHGELKAMGTYQLLNAATAIEAALVLEKQGFYLKNDIETGINQTVWPGRMEVICEEPLVVIDGAHNPGAVQELKQSIDLYFTNQRITFIMGVLGDKDFDSELRIIGNRAVKIITVTPNNPRALNAEKLAETACRYHDSVYASATLEEAVDLARKTVEDDEADMILAFGSLSYLGELKEMIKKQTVKAGRRD